MGKRVRLKTNKVKEEAQPNSYFTSDKSNLQFVTSGCAILDCVLGGGYALGRMTNIIGDKSTAKTHLTCEAVTNFLLDYPTGKAAYRDVEAAFDEDYAEAMGLNVKDVDFGPEEGLVTVEQFFDDFTKFLNDCIKRDVPGIYVLDSLDALSDDAEMARDITKGSYAMGKQKLLGEFFRRNVRKIEKSKVLLIIVSQVRDNIGAMFGEKHRRSGGKAMDFYASQFLWLAHMGQIQKTIKKVKRPIGIEVKAKVKKNKIGIPFRECTFKFLFGYGVDDLDANVNWLKEVNKLEAIGIKDSEVKAFLEGTNELPDKEFNKERKRVGKAVKKMWAEVETTFLPSRRKYNA